MERLVELGVSVADLVRLVAGLCKAKSLELSLLEPLGYNDDMEHYGLEFIMKYARRKGEVGESCVVPLHEDNDSDGEVSAAAQAFIFDILCPYLENMATLVQNLKLWDLDSRMARAFLLAFRENKLTSLEIKSCSDFLGPETEDMQRVFQNLKEFCLDDPDLQSKRQMRLAQLLRGANSLEKACVCYGSSFTRDGFRALLESFNSSERLFHLALVSCLKQQSAQELQMMGRLVATLPRVKHVDISYNDLTDTKLAAFLCELGERKQSLELHLQGNIFGVSSAIALGSTLGHTNAVSSLQLSRVSHDVAVMLFDSLYQCTSLETLIMIDSESTAIGKAGATSMGRMLQHNESISDLRISSDALDGVCTALIFNGLARNRSIAKFRLVAGGCGLEGYRAFGSVIAQNNVLKELELRHNTSVTQAMAREVANSMHPNTTLKRLEPVPTKMEDGASTILLEGFASNHSITSAAFVQFTGRQRVLLQHYLRLNRFGRRHLVDPNLPLELYPWILAKTAKDIVKDNFKHPKWGLDVLWYVVRNRPEVYDVTSRR